MRGAVLRSRRCWGRNNLGQLGNGTNTESDTPVEVEGIANATQVTAGYEHTCALLSTGQIKCWGWNAGGELGAGFASVDSDTRVEVQGITDATRVVAGIQDTCAVLSTGSVECWGENAYGELGNGSTADLSDTPVEVQGIANATDVAIGLRHMCAVLSSGAAKCWGDDKEGELGDGAAWSTVPAEALLKAGPEPTLPELGRCVQLSQRSGVYKNAGCTKTSNGGDTGKYEWRPWPLVHEGFSASAGAATFETAAKTKIKCAASTLGGEYDGPKTAVLTIGYTGCKASGSLRGECDSQGAGPGEIETVALDARLGVIEAGASPIVGWELEPASGVDLATFHCGSSEASLAGSAIASAKPIDKLVAAVALKFDGKGGIQSPAGFEAAPEATLSLTTPGGTEAVGLTDALSLAGEEPIEIKAIE